MQYTGTKDYSYFKANLYYNFLAFCFTFTT